MSQYQPPIADIAFALEHVVGYPDIAKLPGFEHADLDTVVELLDQCGEFMAEAVAPLNRQGDVQGSHLQPDGTVKTPDGFKEAYQQYVDAGWGAVPLPEQYGGGGFPRTVGLAIQEMFNSANLAFSLCPLLTQGAIDALLHYGSDELKDRYLPKMVSGEWTGTMNLTEPQAGSDVGALTTKAVQNADGSYAITGQKIFITYGDHDMAEQIIHLVLARTPGAPEGTRGISCFIVPKYLVNDDGSLGARNPVETVSLEHKMGIHASPTCVLSYENATGYLIGEENKGMRIMFVMMNAARLGVGAQGLAVAERAYQQSLEYAQDRRQGQAIGAAGASSAIIEFPDVRRMLMTQRASIAALRYLLLLDASYVDSSTNDPDPAVRARADEIVGLLTPICKSFGTDLGNELTSLALQIHGGMGFIEETGAAQHVRDIRIAAIYEGTNGIQAADLVGRKLGIRGGASIMEFHATMREIDAELAAAGPDFALVREELDRQFTALETATKWMLKTGLGDPNSVLAGSSPYLRMWGLCTSGWMLARAAVAAAKTDDARLAQEQLVLARFYAQQLLPQCASLLGAATAGADDLFALDAHSLAGASFKVNS
ncbi:alkylation response protein AidB-like acyl-CoA dehydrogenase [Arthrobacter stackebrandtii]|uniref:Alkylation response protein AidB-like acyl-CoA dehydrogenase n=1 Tax=Arthrobacter stackebrandtii TaxID=272161 RepID=A0ABS4Z1T1_9MICC|nr:acyl-CoA dehydrogenase [Arthrobacter stackebrandtii]MBP2415016.1 alkylation response protein AidB-like acyl-CoA dehydrogenase [Arthrobacter stackebrandtii]PYH00832.1 acyl-CoA dehydrogenase [Arthrobacter stackebrandtii]